MRGDGFGLVARLDDGVPLRLERVAQHRAQRVLVLDQQNRRSRRARARASPQPAGRDASLARFFVEIGEGLLAVLRRSS